ncbi:MAG: BolA/IbaG family iron-sulfur metabolism protein [Gammaproteobacteria bacterium]|nr:BolA/IbaG family iron-sulfur metabolism protein [Gammaproteobacteria bacterium]
MTIRESIESKLAGALGPVHLTVNDESSNHNVPDGSESHFRVVIVADCFDDIRLLDRHRMVNAVLQEELAGPVHALALHAYTPRDWKARFGDAPMSPPCLGGSAAEG